MYLTAHRVVSELTGKVGVNAFLYMHGTEPLPGIDWQHPDVVRIAAQVPGTLLADQTELAPGGNLVRSYLDVACADGVPQEDIIQFLDRAEQSIGAPLPCRLEGPIALRFHTEAGIAGFEQEEFRALRAAAISVLKRPPGQGWRSLDPLLVEVETGTEELLLSIPPASRERLAKVAQSWHPSQIKVSHETRSDYAHYYRDLYHQFLLTLFAGVEREVLLALGGVRFVEKGSGRLLFEWPSR